MKTFYVELVKTAQISYLLISSEEDALNPSYDDDLIKFLDSLEIYEMAEGAYEVDENFDLEGLIQTGKSVNIEFVKASFS